MRISNLLKLLGLLVSLSVSISYAEVANNLPKGQTTPTKTTPDPPYDGALPTAPTSTVNTPSMNAAMPVSKPSAPIKSATDTTDTESHGLKNSQNPPTTNSTTASTPKPPTPLPKSTPAPTNTQVPPTNIVVPADKPQLQKTITPY